MPGVDPLHHRSLEPSAADVLRARYAGRLPRRLDELTGPVHGRVELPLHIAWSGLRAYDLDRPRQRMSLYRTVLAQGRRQDVLTFLNRDPIDVHAASVHHTATELERLGERHGRDEFRRQDLRDRLAGAEWYDDEEFASYGLPGSRSRSSGHGPQQWTSDLDRRLGEDEASQDT